MDAAINLSLIPTLKGYWFNFVLARAKDADFHLQKNFFMQKNGRSLQIANNR